MKKSKGSRARKGLMNLALCLTAFQAASAVETHSHKNNHHIVDNIMPREDVYAIRINANGPGRVHMNFQGFVFFGNYEDGGRNVSNDYRYHDIMLFEHNGQMCIADVPHKCKHDQEYPDYCFTFCDALSYLERSFSHGGAKRRRDQLTFKVIPAKSYLEHTKFVGKQTAPFVHCQTTRSTWDDNEKIYATSQTKFASYSGYTFDGIIRFIENCNRAHKPSGRADRTFRRAIRRGGEKKERTPSHKKRRAPRYRSWSRVCRPRVGRYAALGSQVRRPRTRSRGWSPPRRNSRYRKVTPSTGRRCRCAKYVERRRQAWCRSRRSSPVRRRIYY